MTEVTEYTCLKACDGISPVLFLFFVVFMVSFAVQKLVSLIGSHWLIFTSISVTLGRGS